MYSLSGFSNAVNNKTIEFYSKSAEQFASQYDSLSFEAVHNEWLEYLPKEGMILDVGAGSGRDARYLAQRGYSVVAVEPAKALLEIAKQRSMDLDVYWLNDSLPELSSVFALQTKFDLILLSAVWMHIPPSHRQRAFRKLSSLLKPNGKMVISLRHGASPDDRLMFDVSSSEVAELASQFGLQFEIGRASQADQLGRSEVVWETVVCTLPDDGTGAFPLIRNIVVNDSKSSTYKLALLRALLRIAEGHAGAVIEQHEDSVLLPLGLVALYWLKLYKPLVDGPKPMQQSSNVNKGLGFIKPNGWGSLASFANNDFYLGAAFVETSLIDAVHHTLKDISSTIKNMPAKYITLPGTDKAVFEVEILPNRSPKSYLSIDFNYLKSFGIFKVPKRIWDSLTQYSIWIEPALINEWCSVMAGYELNKQHAYSQVDFYAALKWEDAQRNTQQIRDRVQELQQIADLNCCWSGALLDHSEFAIDHAFPFARWPNNDLWNLLPTKHSINANKSDRLPTKLRMQQSKDWILDWWEIAWSENKNVFFTQASFALPGLGVNTDQFSDVFEAMLFQRDRIKSLQQLKEW